MQSSMLFEFRSGKYLGIFYVSRYIKMMDMMAPLVRLANQLRRRDEVCRVWRGGASGAERR